MSLLRTFRRTVGAGVLAGAMVATTQAVLAVAPASAATALAVSTTADVSVSSGACGNHAITTPPSPLSLREAVCLANNIGGAVTINLPAGHYDIGSNGELQLGSASGQNVTIVGAGPASTIIDANGASRVLDLDFNITGGVSTSITGVTIENGHDSTYGGAGIIGGSNLATTADQLTLDHVVLTGNQANGAAPTATNNPGGAVQFFGGSLTITDSVIDHNTAGSSDGSGVAYLANGKADGESLSITRTTFSDNTYTNSAASAFAPAGGALSVGALATNDFTVTDSTFSDNTATASAPNTAVGAGIWLQSGTLSVTGTAFTGNVAGGSGTPAGGAIYASSGTLNAHVDLFSGNTAGAGSAVAAASGAIATATDDWWGCNDLPGAASGCDTTSGPVVAAPRLALTGTATPSVVTGPNATATLTASLRTDSAGTTLPGSSFHAFEGLPVSFSDPPDSATVTTTPGDHTVALSSGQATIDYHSNSVTGDSQSDATFEAGVVTIPLVVQQAPAITSAASASTVADQDKTFTITTTGYPAPAITATGALPSGVTFRDGGNGTATISGTPALGTAGDYPITLTASNGVLPAAIQSFTLTVYQAPAFTSGSTAEFRLGTDDTFAISTSGAPAVSSISESGALPPGLSFVDDGANARITGKPTGSVGGSYPVTLTATNGVDPDAQQDLVVQVDAAPSVTSQPHDQTVAPGSPVTFTAAASGYPAPRVQWQRSTDDGTSFSDITGATTTSYTFTASAGDDRNQYRAVFSNDTGEDTTTAALLRVGTAPGFTSASRATFVAGQADSVDVTTSGVPGATITESGADFPDWLTLTTNTTTGTATLSGTPPAHGGGTYTFTLAASNGFDPAASQTFVLEVDQAAAITSADHATFTTQQSDSLAVTTTAGFPTATTLTESGTLPSGVTFVDGGDGSATLSGTPAPGTGGTYPITITADNGGRAPATTQAFTLTVDASPAFTSADHVTFTVDSSKTFSITTGGYPQATLTETGALPADVTFTPDGSGGATLSGTPVSGTAGSYTLTITADNGLRQVTQQLTLTVVRKQQSITDESPVPAAPVVGGQYDLVASADSGLPVTFTLAPSAGAPACSLSGTTVLFIAAGHCEVDYDQAGNGVYEPAPTVKDSFDVAAIATTTTLVSSMPAAVYGEPTVLTATVSAGADAPDGTIQFAVDGDAFGAPVTVSEGQAHSAALTDADGDPLAPGTHPVSATFVPAAPSRYAGSVGSTSQVVSQAATTTALSVTPHSLRAVVAAVAPGAGTPGGTVRFSVSGVSVGEATLSGGVATLSYTVPSGQTSAVAAVYSGDADFTTSSDSLARTDPTITATLSSPHAATRYGWYRSPVTVTFHCTAPGAALTAPCPAPVTLSRDGGGQSLSRTVQAADGGTATVTVSGIDIDHTAPRLRVAGVGAAAVRRGAGRPRCVAKDSLSGVASCRIKRHTAGGRTSYRARATDRAGNVTVVKGHYRTTTVTLAGARFRHGAYDVTLGRTYTLVVTAATRPTYYDAAVYPQRPTRRDKAFRAAGHHRWALGVTMSRMGGHTYWNLGVKVGGTKRVLKVRVHR
jgi:hypothetical protein